MVKSQTKSKAPPPKLSLEQFDPGIIKAELWKRGEISWKLYKPQLEIHDVIIRTKVRKIVAKCSRRLGKSFALMAYAISRAVKNPYSRIPFAAPTYKDLKNILIPIVREITKDCPTYMRPVFKVQDSIFVFPANHSEIQMAGVNNGNAEALRGKEALDCIVDEAGFVDELRYLVNDVLMPQLIYSADGKLILSSTPPISPAHDFVSFLAEAEANNSACSKTIYDNPRLSPSTIVEYAKEAGCDVEGDKIVNYSTTFRREYLAEVITDSTHAVVPEFTEAMAQKIVKDWPRPEMFKAYTFVDTGYIDFTAAVFCYYDFKNAKIVVEDELVIDVRQQNKNSAMIADEIKRRENDLWGANHEVYGRFADGDLLLLADFSSLHSLHFTPVSKDVLEAQVNHLRLDIQRETVIINPRCKNTIAHCKYAVYDKQRKKLERSETMGHFDCLMALVYAVRHINRSVNPYPALYKVDTFNSFVRPEETQVHRELNKLFHR